MSEIFTIDRDGDRWRLSGQLDEQAHLVELAHEVGDNTLLRLDLERITHINSLGVRDWTRFLRRLNARGVRVRLERCAEVLVQQMNMIEDARGAAEVASFLAPYVCNDCGWEGHLVLATADIAPVVARGAAPDGTCPECARPARFADFVDRYFLFLI